MIKINTFLWIGLLTISVTLSSVSYAKPFCALRDPTHEVYELFPEATSYKSIVHTVDKNTRNEILSVLPFTIHSKEIGEHTVYVSLIDERPLGVVHVRSELGSWGLLEIAWALDLNNKIIDFRFQRCREEGCDEIGSDSFRQQIAGMGVDELSELVNDSGSELLMDKLNLTPESMKLAASVIRSGMKTIVVTDMVWGEDLNKLKEAP